MQKYNQLSQVSKQWNEEEDFVKWEEYYKEGTRNGKSYYGQRSIARQKKILQYLDSLNLKKESQILELAYGSGMTSAEIYRRGFNITGVDISHKFCKLAIKNCKQFRDKKSKVKFDFKVGNVEKLKFSDNKFDCIIGSGFLQYTEDPLSCLKGVFRVLKPEGYFIIAQRNMYGFGCLDGFLKLIKPVVYLTTNRKYELRWQDTILAEPIIIFAKLTSPFSSSMKKLKERLVLRKKTGWVKKTAFSFSRLKKILGGANFKIVRYDGAGYLTKKVVLLPGLARKLDVSLQTVSDNRKIPFIYKLGDNIIFLAQKKKDIN